MRTIFALCGLILIVGGFMIWKQFRLPTEAGQFSGAPKVEVADLIARPTDFLRKTVSIEGVVRKQCTTMGCYFFFLVGERELRVDISEIAMNAPRRNGRLARVEGQIVPYGDGYQFWASAVKFE